MIEDVFLALYLALLQPVLGQAEGPVEAAVGIATADDVLLVFTIPEQRLATEQRIRAVHRSGRMAQWRGDTGL